MLGTSYAVRAGEISSARGTSTVVGFGLLSMTCSTTSPDGNGGVPVPNVSGISILPLLEQ